MAKQITTSTNKLLPFIHMKGLNPLRNQMNLDYEVKTTMDMGDLEPILLREVLPGDIVRVAVETIIRMMPTIAPILHEIYVTIELYFIPNRILDDNWETFITGGKTGDETPPVLTIPSGTGFLKGSLADKFGLAIGISYGTDNDPIALPFMAYNKTYNDHYRDERLIDEIPLDSTTIRKRAWEKDKYTSASVSQQLGMPINLPLAGIVPVTYDNISSTVKLLADNVDNADFHPSGINNVHVDWSTGTQNNGTSPVQNAAVHIHNSDTGNPISGDIGVLGIHNSTNPASVNLSNVGSILPTTMRDGFGIQKWQEISMLFGNRYTEMLMGHFHENNDDRTLQRAKLIGYTRMPLIVSEVLQTSESGGTPLGSLGGHGITGGQNTLGSYHVKEHGWLLGIMSIMPRVGYASQGIHKQFSRKTKFDYYWATFANLSQEAILNKELYVSGDINIDNEIFGFQSIWDEYRTSESIITGDMRDIFAYWHLNRIFNETPTYNESFINCVPDKRIFAVQDEPGFVVSVGNKIDILRRMPQLGIPGNIDHAYGDGSIKY